MTMRYQDDAVGFSFELPDCWRRDEHNIMITFYGPNGGPGVNSEVIQLLIGGILPHYVDPANRGEFLREAGAEVYRTDIGGERNAVVLQRASNSEISVVRDGVQYTFSHSNDATTQAAIERIRNSAEFPSREQAAEAIHLMSSNLAPQLVAKALLAGSPEAARHALAEAGAPGARMGTGTLHYLGEERGTERQTPTASSGVPGLPAYDSLTVRLSNLEKRLDGDEGRERRRAEQELIAIRENATCFLLESVDRINQELLKFGPEEDYIRKLERRVRILAQIEDVRAAKTLISAVADAADAVKTLQSQYVYDGGTLRAAKALRKTGIKALVAIGEPALPIIDSAIPYASLPAAAALWCAASRIRKKWWQLWRL